MSNGSSLGNLPGFFWDPVRRRYFPISQSNPSSSTSSRNQNPEKRSPPPESSSTSQLVSHGKHNKRENLDRKTKDRNGSNRDVVVDQTLEGMDISDATTSLRSMPRTRWRNARREIRNGLSYADREKASHDLNTLGIASRLSSGPSQAPSPSVIGNSVTTFASSQKYHIGAFDQWGARPIRFIGDSQGWLYSYIDPPQDLWSTSLSDAVEVLSEINLHPHGEVSSISLSEDLCMFVWLLTALGMAVHTGAPTVRLVLVQQREYLYNIYTSQGIDAMLASVVDTETIPTSRTTIVTLPSVHDVRCSTILPSSAHVLGAAKKAVHINSPEIRHGLRELPTGSDVFSLCSTGEDIVYAGCRYGQVLRFDLRAPNPKADKLRLSVSGYPKSTVVHMSTLPIPDWEMLVGRMDGELRTFDLRFVSSKSEVMPTRSFNGHVGGLNPRSSIAVSSEGNYVFAAGDDGCIRGWSLRTGEVDSQIITAQHGHRMCLSVANEGVEGFVGDQLWAAGIGESGRGIVRWCI